MTKPTKLTKKEMKEDFCCFCAYDTTRYNQRIQASYEQGIRDAMSELRSVYKKMVHE